MTLVPLQPAATLSLYTSEVLSKLKRAERCSPLQDRYIAETRAQLALTQHLNTL